MKNLRKWLVKEGWHVTEVEGVLRVQGDPRKLAEEADQLFRDIQDGFGLLFDPVLGKQEDGFAPSIKAFYDPSTGEAAIDITATP